MAGQRPATVAINSLWVYKQDMTNPTPKLQTLHIAFFLKESSPRPDQIWAQLSQGMADVFDQAPIILPVPDDFRDVPVVIVSGSHQYDLRISRNNVNLSFRASEGQNLASIITPFKSKAQLIASTLNGNVNRAGFASRHLLSTDDTSLVAKVIKDEIKNIGGTRIIKDAAIKLVCEDMVAGKKVADVTALEFQKYEKQPDQEPGVIMLRDVYFTDTSELPVQWQDLELLISFAESKVKLEETAALLYAN